jgi:hypothetical protein
MKTEMSQQYFAKFTKIRFMKAVQRFPGSFVRGSAGLPKHLEGLEQDVRVSSGGDLSTREAARRGGAVKSNWQWVDNDG